MNALNLLQFSWKEVAFMLLFFALGYSAYLLFFHKLTQHKTLFSALFLLFYVVLISFGVTHYENLREHKQRQVWANKLAQPRDFETEKLFAQKAYHLKQDAKVKDFILREANDSLTFYLKQHYFPEGWRGYNFYFTYCKNRQQLQLEDGQILPCREFFERKITHTGSQTNIPDLFVINYGVEYYSYLYKPCLCQGEQHETHLFIEWGRQKISKETEALPHPYSYAYYVDSNLWSHRGSFLYPFKTSLSTGTSGFVNHNGLSHLLYSIPKGQLLIISRPIPHWSRLVYDVSFYLCLFLLLTFLCEIIRKPGQFKARSYSQKLQYTIFGLVLCAFLVLGLVSFFFIRELNYHEHTSNLREKTLSILTELENKQLGKTDIKHLSKLLSTDIYLYDARGRFQLSNTQSPPKEAGLSLSSAFSELSSGHSHLLIKAKENKDGRYWVAYAPFRNANNEILGYLVVPSYWNLSEWNNEVSRYLSAYLNLFVLLGLLTFVASYWLARYVTRSLQILGQSVSEVKLMEKNHPLDWKSEDEIGQLVKQYNRMVNQLEESAHRLAESERQNAWREMAKQVAHEIKNPLTPLKLQAQQLQRSYQDGKSDFSQRLQTFTALLCGQIDLLSRIADTFSHISQWQQPNLQAVSLKNVLQSTCTLFSGHEQIQWEINIQQETLVWADPQMLEQIFTNLLRNAVQALEEKGNPKPTIHIEAIPQGNRLYIHIQDNGPGITSEALKRIFEPHFTTRSSGSGLGLAISLRIAESMNGHLSARSTLGKGSLFILDLALIG